VLLVQAASVGAGSLLEFFSSRSCFSLWVKFAVRKIAKWSNDAVWSMKKIVFSLFFKARKSQLALRAFKKFAILIVFPMPSKIRQTRKHFVAKVTIVRHVSIF